MMRFVSFVSMLFLDGFVLISLAAVALAIATDVQAGVAIAYNPLYLLLFSGTMVSYNWHRLLKNRRKNLSDLISANRLVLLMLILMAPLALFSLSQLNRQVLEILFPLAFISFLYSLPTRWNLWFFPLRKIPFIKVFLVSVTWSFVTVIVPLADNPAPVTPLVAGLIFLGRVLLFLGVTIPFDIRDSDSDKEAGIRTLPVIFGVDTAKKIAQYATVLFPVPVIWLSFISGRYNLLASDFFTMAVVIGLLLCRKCWNKPTFYTFYLDGSLIVYGLVTLLFSLLFR